VPISQWLRGVGKRIARSGESPVLIPDAMDSHMDTLPTEPPVPFPSWDQSMGSSGFTAGGSPEPPDRLLTTGNRRLHNALFGYVAGLLSTIGCLEGHSVKPVEVAAHGTSPWVPPALQPEVPLNSQTGY
jgi:hypothetical protein